MRSTLFLATLIALRAGAQNADSIRAGARVRVWETQPTGSSVVLVASVRSADAASITLDAPAGPITVPRTSITQIDLSGGPSSGPRWRSGLIGGIAGVVGGGLLGVIIGNASNHNAPKFGAAGLVGGGVLGAAIGAMHPGEQWVRARVDRDTSQ
jgi:hypothetical protein